MDKNNDAMKEIKKLLVKFGFLKEDVVPETKETDETYENFLSVVLEDGTNLTVEGDELVVGAVVTVSNEDSEIPAPDGEYTLEDGTMIAIVDGKIESITPKEDETPEDTPEVIPEAAAEEVTDTTMVELVDLVKLLIEKLGEMGVKVTEMEAEIKEFGKTPAGGPIKYDKTEVPEKKLTPLEARIAAISGMKNKTNN